MDDLTKKELLSKCPYRLTLTIEELTNPSAKKCGNPDKPPRPQNSWIIFRRDYEANLRLRNPDVKIKVTDTAKECSLKWKSKEVKDFFKLLEKIAYMNHKNIYPNYKFKPGNVKYSSCKRFIPWEQKKRASTSSSSAKSSSTYDTSFRGVIEINASPPLTNYITDNSCSSTPSTTQYNPHNDVSINNMNPITMPTLSTSIDNLRAFSNNHQVYDNNLIDNGCLFDENFNDVKNNSTQISTPVDITNTASIPTTPFISSPSSHAQLLYLSYDSTYITG
ncbi:4769_t:CDS:1 [Ambispora gerdemannii]|uniref:4769_t:CDS:1 n=1 Tax=Ambispora gerdemannii TaxID=144530 RepID=A0A9N9GFH5_9GLOM|nr:4769_t:CDS:1 [Ambispora gerdemannii]